MKNIVLIPCFKRPEFMYYLLALIKKADGYKKYRYVFALDFGYDHNCKTLAEQFDAEKEIVETTYMGYKEGKQSYNVLHNLIKYGEQSNDHIILLEDDVMISNQFFKWHEKSWKTVPEAFAYVGSKNNNDGRETSMKTDEVYIGRRGDYQGIGTSYDKNKLMKYVAPFDRNDYYMHTTQFCQKHFPESMIGHSYSEQDGLIRRVIEKNDLKILYPHFPVCYHAGYYGKNRGVYNKKTINERIKEVGDIIFNCDEMKKNAVHPEWYIDSEPTQLCLTKIKKIKLTNA